MTDSAYPRKRLCLQPGEQKEFSPRRPLGARPASSRETEVAQNGTVSLELVRLAPGLLHESNPRTMRHLQAMATLTPLECALIRLRRTSPV